jgi:Tfp pilus assembly protein PilO
MNATPEQIHAPRRRPVMLGPLGLPEAIALALSLLLAVGAALSYFLVWQPNVAQLGKLQRDRENARYELRQKQEAGVNNSATQQAVDEIAASVIRFERAYLSRRETGRLALYKLLNQLLRRNNVKNTSGPAYAPLLPLKPEEQNRKQEAAGQKGNDRWQTIYPGLNVNMTVEGKYADLRRFIRELEATGQFIIINTVELEGTRNRNQDAENPNLPPNQPPPLADDDEQRRGERVSLRLDLAVYFQRDDLAALEAAAYK